ncbi:dTDP-4-dehydrorhamnose reductase [Endozoicomonas euniceicola]|uniref:dTDP-4-dehydrorhamnose reductase n=1 Tax=Endozoicomonas euniceicola TaxID=1234143 RepID=A0ABY6GWI2_9GAMM|nr:dTDP-4-dehydrorhamnose reductase [Endozoicomonas euniceicola]UYM16426.1 dTDP-4-dehydrorhamnose reductase [Endozoicomonas euniceicola]
MKILITGKNGQIGFELKRALAPFGEVVAIGKEECNFLNQDDIRRCVQSVNADIIVNPAAYTMVDKAESEQDKAFAINATAPGVIAQEAEKAGALLVHYSTDYVFNGQKQGGYTELDQPDPRSIYGLSKWQGEQAVFEASSKSLILRTSWVFGAYGNNFAKTMLRLAAEKEQLNIVADQFGAPTSAALIADITAQILAQYTRSAIPFKYGLYHITANGLTNWHEYAQYVIQKGINAGLPIKLGLKSVDAISSDEYPTPAFRPKNSQLDCSKLKTTFNVNLPPWQQGLDHVLTLLLR